MLDEEQKGAFRVYETEAYEVVRCQIEMKDVQRLMGLTFSDLSALVSAKHINAVHILHQGHQLIGSRSSDRPLQDQLSHHRQLIISSATVSQLLAISVTIRQHPSSSSSRTVASSTTSYYVASVTEG